MSLTFLRVLQIILPLSYPSLPVNIQSSPSANMLASIFVLASALALPALAAPSVVKREFAPYVADVEIHESCNATERRQLTKALSDTMEVAQLAKNYLVANGPTDEVYKLYFGDGNWLTAMGAFDGILNSNKEGVLLRCDNIDGNCGQEGESSLLFLYRRTQD